MTEYNIIIIILKSIIFLFFLFMAAYFSAAETAITSLTPSAIRRIKDKHNKLYKYIIYWEKRPNDIITTLLVWMNLSVVAVGVVTTSMGLDIIEIYSLDKILWMSLFPVIAIIVTLIFANIIPKTISRFNAEKYAVLSLPLVVKLNHITRHLNSFLNANAKIVLKIFGRGNSNENQNIQAEEVNFLLSNEKTSPLSPGARNIVNRVIEFRKTKITQVMVSRSDILAVNIEQPKEKVIQEIIDTQFSRVPIYRESMNNIIGIVNVKDIAANWRTGGLFAIEDILRPVYYVPETAYVKQMLADFKTNRQHMAIVVDEFGSTIGLVTIEDILEEIIGEVWDEYDIKEKNIVKIKDNEYIIDAGESISNVNDELKINIPEDHFSTINGWVLECFGHIPKAGEKITNGNFEIEIKKSGEKKVKKILLKYKNVL